MELTLEHQDEIASHCNQFAAKEELVELLEGFQQGNGETSPLEAVALHLTMRQIDPVLDMPVTEMLHVGNQVYTHLATESLKDSIKDGWSKFVTMMRNLYKKAMDKIREMIRRIRAKFSKVKAEEIKHGVAARRAGKQAPPKQEAKQQPKQAEEPISKAERFDPNPEPEPQQQSGGEELELGPFPTDYFGMPGLENLEALMARAKLIGGMGKLVAETSAYYTGKVVPLVANNPEGEEYKDFLMRGLEEQVDGFITLGGKMKKGIFEIPLNDDAAFCIWTEDREVAYIEYDPTEENNTAVIRVQRNSDELYDVLDQITDLVPVLTALSNAAEDAERDLKAVEKVTNIEAQRVLMSLQPFFHRRIRIIGQLMDLLNGLTDIAVVLFRNA